MLCLEQTSDGYLWLGTKGGLARFDGVRFEVYGLADGLGSVIVTALLDDGDGGVWIGTLGGGLSRMSDGCITTVTTADGLLSDDVLHIAGADDGTIWVGTGAGVQRWAGADHSGAIGASLGAAERVRSLATGPAGEVWFGIEEVGLFRYQDGACEFIESPETTRKYPPSALLVDSGGDLWASVGNGVLLTLRGGRWSEYTTSDGVPMSFLYCLAERVPGEIWAGSHEQGLHVFRGGRFHPVHGGDDPAIRSIEIANDGAVWVGTLSDGVTRYAESRIGVYPVAAPGELRGVAELGEGEFWIATWGGGLFRCPLDAIERVGGIEAVDTSQFVQSCLRADSGDLYVAGHTFVLRRDAGTGEIRTVQRLDESYTSLCEEPGGSVLVGGLDGIVRRLSGLDPSLIPSGDLGAPIAAMARHADEGVWIATRGTGLHRVNQSGAVERWSTADGLPTDLLSALYEDAEGTLWIGTQGRGLAWFRGERFGYVNTSQGLHNDVISSIIEDDDGDLWLGSIRGISRVSKRRVFEVEAGTADALHPVVIDESDGMTEPECTLGFSPSGVRTRDGRLLFSTVRSLVLVDPVRFKSRPAPPDARIESVEADGARASRASSGKPPPEFPPGTREVAIRFTAFNDANPAKIRFKHRLRGLDDAWTDTHGTRQARFVALDPGRYEFEVAAANDDGIWQTTPTSVSFTVRPFYWQTGWFRAGAMVLIIASGAGAMGLVTRHRIVRLRARERLAQAEAAASEHRNHVAHLTRVASLGELSASLAHELNQPLAAILSNAQAAQRFLASKEGHDEDIKEILGDIVEDDKRASEVIKRLRTLLKKSEFHPQPADVNAIARDAVRLMEGELRARRVGCTFRLAEELPAVPADHVQLQQVLLNLILNACDAMAAVPATERRLEIRTTGAAGGGVQVCVSDTGPGIAPEGEGRVFDAFFTTKPQGLGFGLSLSRTIIEAHRGTLLARNREGGGARFTFKLPAPNP
ncbi:MAG: hypothetical protein DHS20C14_01870 [Phycisphaeraceae bacterium]|nr:MAG: hypothetical protein DHS20C14_01870 [Phycisphaeraceae bacterium]